VTFKINEGKKIRQKIATFCCQYDQNGTAVPKCKGISKIWNEFVISDGLAILLLNLRRFR